jgi:hypothetical protein
MDEINEKIEGQNCDELTPEKLEELMNDPKNGFSVALAANSTILQTAMETPFIFVVAVDPRDGAFQYVVKSDKPHVSEILMKHFGEAWNKKIVPEVRAKEPRILTNRPLIIMPGR